MASPNPGQPYSILRYDRIIWAPTLTNHDPNPPITIEDGSLTDSVTETVAASDSQTATLSTSAVITESVAATETQSAGNTFSDTVVETVAASESQTGAAGFVTALTETVTATESSTGTVPASFSDTVSESVSASDSCDATVFTPPVPPPPPVPLPGPLYGLTPVGVSSATSEIRAQGTRSARSPLRGIGVAGNKDSIHPVKGPVG